MFGLCICTQLMILSSLSLFYPFFLLSHQRWILLRLGSNRAADPNQRQFAPLLPLYSHTRIREPLGYFTVVLRKVKSRLRHARSSPSLSRAFEYHGSILLAWLHRRGILIAPPWSGERSRNGLPRCVRPHSVYILNGGAAIPQLCWPSQQSEQGYGYMCKHYVSMVVFSMFCACYIPGPLVIFCSFQAVVLFIGIRSPPACVISPLCVRYV